MSERKELLDDLFVCGGCGRSIAHIMPLLRDLNYVKETIEEAIVRLERIGCGSAKEKDEGDKYV